MTDTPPQLTDEQLATIRAHHERTVHPDWRSSTDVGQLLAEVDRLRAENAGLDGLRLRAIDKGDRLRAERDQARAALGSIESLAERADRKGYDLDVAEILEAARAGWES